MPGWNTHARTPPPLAALAALLCARRHALHRRSRPRGRRAPCSAVYAALAHRPQASTPSPAPALTAAQQRYLALAKAGVARARGAGATRVAAGMTPVLGDRKRYPLATIWDIVPLFQSLDAIAIAQPNAANRRALTDFAAGAERYLNRGLRPVPGYSPYPGTANADTETWFDDNGWWGLAFLKAYRATGTRRYLADAERALRYIAAAGWDRRTGGIWWNTDHPYKAGAALAADTLLATLIYQQTRSAFALGQARTFLRWGNTAGFSAADGLYAGSNVNPTPVDYIEGPLIYAQATLCRADRDGRRLRHARRACRRRRSTRFGYLLDFSPQYDAIYLQWMLALYCARRRPHAVRACRRQRARRADARRQRRRPVPALLERRNAARALRRTGDAADAGRHHQRVRLAGRVPAAA